MAKPKQTKVFQQYVVVEGSGEFPWDMLRYDAAHPTTEKDTHIAQHESKLRRVAVCSRAVNDQAPCYPRWESFCWKVVAVFEQRSDAEECRDRR